MASNFYPTSPQVTTQKLTAITSSYKFRAFLAILSIILFFVLYVLLVIAIGFFVKWTITDLDFNSSSLYVLIFHFGIIAATVMLFLFTLKFILKLRNHKPENRLQLSKKEYPDLWNFVLQICEETGAPKPRRIYADPDVNAYVNYTNTWLSLFLPVQKDLTVGLGLVSCLNLSEFKAVVSHEFGHFAQSSMKIGSYIHSANTIIHDMIFSRDRWDTILEEWRGADLRLSAAAWLITPIVWIIRQILALFYQFLNKMHASLSREMEFNADKVAVSTSGSEAIVSALWNLEIGMQYWGETLNHAYLAAQKKLYVSNFYKNNQLAIDRGADKRLETWKNFPLDQNNSKIYFSESLNSKVGMYASHPPNDKRELNAKTPFIDCAIDKRSSWLLFNDKEMLQEKMTMLVYDKYWQLKPEEFVTIEEMESFIKAESLGKELSEKYLHTFENRFLTIETPFNTIIPLEKETYKQKHEELIHRLKDLMNPVKEIDILIEQAVQISEGTTVVKSFQFQDKKYHKRNLQEGYEKLLSTKEKLLEDSFKEWDLDFVTLNLGLAKSLGKDIALQQLYVQHQSIIDIYKAIINTHKKTISGLNNLQAKSEVSHSDISGYRNIVNFNVTELNENIANLKETDFYPLPNIKTLEELQEALIPNKELKKVHGDLFQNGSFNSLIQEIEMAKIHCQRIEQKSIATILMYQEKILS